MLLTVPASFDEEARELTVQAAASAGLKHVTLLEEPQAAFYAWIDGLGDSWRRRVGVGDLILVCDVGGGTTDFSLIAVAERDGELALERVAVGEHILLGGDNMDLALARLLQQRLEGRGHKVDTWQLHGLWHQCRLAKEALLTDPSQRERPVTLLGRGSRLVGGSIRTTLTIDDVNQVLLDGFFPAVRAARDAGAASGASGSRSSACPMPPIPRSRATSPASCRGRPATPPARRRSGAARRAWPARRTSSSTAAS